VQCTAMRCRAPPRFSSTGDTRRRTRTTWFLARRMDAGASNDSVSLEPKKRKSKKSAVHLSDRQGPRTKMAPIYSNKKHPEVKTERRSLKPLKSHSPKDFSKVINCPHRKQKQK